jgi:electron transfer flavoprotein alpha/beta subunit
MQAKKKPVDTKTCSDLGIEPAGQQVIQSVEPIPARQAGEIIEDEGEGYLKIIEKLEEVKVI